MSASDDQNIPNIPKYFEKRQSGQQASTIFNQNESGRSVKTCVFIIVILLSVLVLVCFIKYMPSILSKSGEIIRIAKKVKDHTT